MISCPLPDTSGLSPSVFYISDISKWLTSPPSCGNSLLSMFSSILGYAISIVSFCLSYVLTVLERPVFYWLKKPSEFLAIASAVYLPAWSSSLLSNESYEDMTLSVSFYCCGGLRVDVRWSGSFFGSV